MRNHGRAIPGPIIVRFTISSTHRRRARRDCSMSRLPSVNAIKKVNGAKSKRHGFSRIRLVNSTIRMIGKSFQTYWASYSYGTFDLPNPLALGNTLQPLLLQRMCATGRCMFRPEAKDAELKQLEWDDSATWQFWLVVKPTGNQYALTLVLRNGFDEIEFFAAPLITEAVVIGPDFKIARFASHGALAW